MEQARMDRFKLLFITVFLCILTVAARAEIVWDQPYSGQDYRQNLNFEGNDTLHPADVRKLQKSLAAKGFYKGRIDGLWGGRTTQALLDYQAVHQQALTGTVTIATLHELGIYPDQRLYR